MALISDRFDELYRAHAPAAFRRARRLLGSDADAYELVHDVFVSLLQRPEQYAGKSSLSTFLYSTVTHACLNRLRNQRNRLRLVQQHASGASQVKPAQAQPELHAAVRAALERMPEPLAQVAVYYYVDELTHEDIARILGCSRRHIGDLLERLARWADHEEAEACSS